MRFFEFIRNRDTLTKVFRILQQIARSAESIADAREALAKRLAIGARAGDFDDAIKRMAESDALVEDFLRNG
jgi:hypothetical protein